MLDYTENHRPIPAGRVVLASETLNYGSRSGRMTRSIRICLMFDGVAEYHGFSRKFGWLNDRFGVSWQLNLE